MGFFSFTCAVCSYDMLHGNNPGYNKYAWGVVFFDNGDRMSGEYDGYGRLGSVDISDIDSGLGTSRNKNDLRACSYKLVHQACFKKGMTLDSIEGYTTHGNEQGFWPGERIAHERWGPPHLSEIQEKSTYVCFQCHRVWDAKFSAGACAFGCDRPVELSPHEETVEAFTWRRDGMANALAICRNTNYKFVTFAHKEKGVEPAPENCWRFGQKQLIVGRLSPDEESWRRELAESDGQSFDWKPSCGACKSPDHLEFFKLVRSPLEHLAAL